MTIKIENYSGSADTFTLPHNPRVFDVDLDHFVDQKDFPFAFTFFGLTDPLKSKQGFVLNGFFDGATKNASYRELKRNVNTNVLKKLYFSSDRFAIVIPGQVKRTHSGGRTNFIDYVASFISPFGILFDDTQQSGTSTGSESNGGDVPTPIEKITGSVTNGNAVEISDSDGNGFAFTPNATGTVTINIIEMIALGSGNVITDYIVAKIGSTKQVLSVATNNKQMVLKLAAAQSLNTLFTGGTVSGITSASFFFRDGHSAD